MKVAKTGVDLAKEIFQIHAADAHGKAVLRKQASRCDIDISKNGDII